MDCIRRKKNTHTDIYIYIIKIQTKKKEQQGKKYMNRSTFTDNINNE